MADTVGNLLVRIGADVSGLSQASTEANTILRRIDATARTSAGGFSALERAVISVNQGLQLLGGAASTVAGIGRSFFEQADAASQLSAQIRLVTSSQEEAASTQAALLGLSNETRTSLETTTTLYSRIARATGDLGLSQQELLTVTKAINQSLVIGGASAAEASAGVIQLTQALGTGALRGDELRSVMESMPTVAKILADSLGVTVGQLKALGESGALSSRLVIQALAGASAQVNQQFAKIPTTAEQAFTVLRNEALAAAGEIDRATGATQLLVRAINEIRTAGVAALPALVENLRAAGAEAKRLGEGIAANRTTVFTALELGAGAAGAALTALGIKAAASSALIQGAFAALATPFGGLVALITAVGAAFVLEVAQMQDQVRAGNQAADAMGNLAVATAAAAARGQTLTSSQRAQILAGQNYVKVLQQTAAASTAAGTASETAASKITLVGEAISKAVAKAQKDVAIFGVAVGQVPVAVSAAFSGVAQTIADAVKGIPSVPSESFVTLAQNVNRSALAMTSLGAQAATLIQQMQALDTSTAQGSAQFDELNKQLAEVRSQSQIVFTTDLTDLSAGLKEVKEEIDKGVDPVQIKTNADSLRQMAEAIKAQVKKTNDEGLIVDVTLLADKFLKQLDDTMKKADQAVDSFYDRLRFKPPATIKVTPQFELQQFVAELDAIRSRIVDTPEGDLKLKLKADAAELEKKIADKRAEIEKGATLPVDADTTKVNKKLDEVESRIQTITFGFGQITGQAASGQDIQATIDRLRQDLVQAIQAGDRAAQERLRGSGAEFLKTFGTSAGGLTASERKQILDIIGPFASAGTAAFTQNIGLRPGFADPTLTAAVNDLRNKQQEQNRLQADSAASARSQAASSARTATATESIATTLATGRFGSFAASGVQQTVQRTTGVRGSVFRF